MKPVLVPHITEKAYRFVTTEKKQSSSFTFKVPKQLEKAQIKSLVEKEFKVHVLGVQVINLPGKVRRFKGKVGKTQAVRKAIVKLKPGEQIAAFTPESKSIEEKS